MTPRPQHTKTFQFRIKRVALEIALVSPSSRLQLAKRDEWMAEGSQWGFALEEGVKPKPLFFKKFYHLPMFLAPANCLEEREILWIGCFNEAWFHLLEFQFLKQNQNLEKKSHPLGDVTKTCTSKNEFEPQHNWRRQSQERVWALPKSTCRKWQFFIGKYICF